MKRLFITVVLLIAPATFAQRTFDLTDASKYFDIKVKVATCDENFCNGKATFSFYKKRASTPYQVVNLPDTSVHLLEDGSPSVNVSLLYDQQSVVNVGDFNFDGMEDVAICNGTNGSYYAASYNIYLSSRAAKKFVYNAAFSKLGHHLGMFTVDEKKKTLATFDKSGCCVHFLTEYKVVGNKPKKVKEVNEYYDLKGDGYIETETKILVNGKWRTSVKREKVKDH